MPDQPPYAPNVVNQTVSYGGTTWKGNPGTGWTPEGGASSSSSTGSSDYNSIVQNQLKLQQDANQPAIQSLQSSIPEIQNKFSQESSRLQAQQQPLEQRYQTLLGQIKSNQQKEEQRTGIAGARELGRRGISSESGFYDQYQNEKLSPVTQFYTGEYAKTGQNREDAIRQLQDQISGLTTQETEQERAVKNAIVQLQSGGNSSAITSALQQYQFNQSAQNSAQEAERDRNLKIQLSGDGGSSQNRYITLGDGATLYDTQSGQIVANNPKNFANGGGGGWE